MYANSVPKDGQHCCAIYVMKNNLIILYNNLATFTFVYLQYVSDLNLKECVDFSVIKMRNTI